MKHSITSKHNTVRIVLIVFTVIFGALIFPNLGAAMISPMLFDSPGSENSTVLFLAFIAIIAYTPITLISIAMSWILFAKKKTLASLISMAFPLLVILIGLLAFVVIFVFCNGSLDC